MDRVGSQCVQIDPKKVVAVVDTELPDAGNVRIKPIRSANKLPIT
jgi:acyl-CoA hydrolase